MEQIAMPQLGETVTEGTVIRWLKHEGEPIGTDEPLFEVSTDKVDTEVPSAHAGWVRALLVAEGDTVPIGTVVALIANAPDEPLPDLPATPETVPAATRAAEPSSGRHSRSSPPPADGRPFLSPVVRDLLDEHGLDETDVHGSGRDGRITRADVLAAAAAQSAAAGDRSRPMTATRDAEVGVAAGASDDVVPFSAARRATADHMRRSLDTSAHALVVTEVDYAGVDRVRAGRGLSYLPFVARAVLDALRAFPLLNASVGADCLIVHRQFHLGIAVDVTGEALVVPVIRDADQLRLQGLADAVAGVAERARTHRLALHELTGATFTLTNVGAYGTLVTAPIINQPQVAICSTDGVRPKPVACEGPGGEWAVTVHPVGNLSLSFDHRAVDGAYAAGFLALVRDTLQSRDWAAEV